MKVAIIGAGVAGLTAGYRLSRAHEVSVFEKSNRIGGNAYTYTTRDGQTLDIAVAAFGKAGYKHFYALLSELGVKTVACARSYMSFHDLDTKKGIYLTGTLAGFVQQKFQLFRGNTLKEVFYLLKGLNRAQALLEQGALSNLTLEQAIALIPEFTGNTRIMFLCTLCLLSSMECSELLQAPAAFFISKLRTHSDVISPKALYSVRCINGGTQTHIAALAAGFRDRILLNSKIYIVHRDSEGIRIILQDGQILHFDKIIFACPADEALRLLALPTEAEKTILGAWKYKDGRVVLHRDHSSFPARELTQAYTFLYTQRYGVLQTSVNGALWHEPQAPSDSDYISSQHPNFSIQPKLIELETVLRTPIFDSLSCATIPQLPSLNGVMNTFYCGSHFGYGLHEDAITSALTVTRCF
jgi:uncharacterized protein